MRLLQDFNFKNKTVLVRVDFNVPIEKGKVLDNSRIKAAIPTINYLVKKNAKVLLLSHLGQPKGNRVQKLSLVPVSQELSNLLKKPVKQLKDCVSPFIVAQIESMKSGEIVLLENVRFYKEEEKNDTLFAKKLASLADMYVNDAFSVCHRKHASVAQLPKLMPSCAGLQLQKEIEELKKVLNPKKPFVVLLGGAKVSDKLALIENLAKRTDKLLIGGAMIFPFLKLKGLNVGKSKLEKESLEPAEELVKIFSNKLVLPTDVVVAEDLSEKAQTKAVKIEEIPEKWFGVDLGPETIKDFEKILSQAATIFWNGPVGLFEIEKFAKGTKEIAKFLANHNGFVVIGGGETLSAVSNYKDKYGHVSMGGGACLDFLSGKELPGIKALE
ncbi:phosphoglycerate kinase [Candidatus Woesearchaeota archaeon]|nr:phosphoglycerate kinase [Candidatus Woesearchaeota archaeon]